jgi:hypothetical protein
MTPDASVTDGLLDLCVIENMSRRDFARLAVQVKRGEHLGLPADIVHVCCLRRGKRGRRCGVEHGSWRYVPLSKAHGERGMHPSSEWKSNSLSCTPSLGGALKYKRFNSLAIYRFCRATQVPVPEQLREAAS